MDAAGENLQANNCLKRFSHGLKLNEDNLEQPNEEWPVQGRLVRAAPDVLCKAAESPDAEMRSTIRSPEIVQVHQQAGTGVEVEQKVTQTLIFST